LPDRQDIGWELVRPSAEVAIEVLQGANKQVENIYTDQPEASLKTAFLMQYVIFNPAAYSHLSLSILHPVICEFKEINVHY
jgi:3-dehydroquinate dehydratase